MEDINKQLTELVAQMKNAQFTTDAYGNKVKLLPGEKGDKGDAGEKGDTGAQGEDGFMGVRGEKGPKGEKGDTGEQGAPGINGINGSKGKDGTEINGAIIVDKLAKLPKEEKLSFNYLKNIPKSITDFDNQVRRLSAEEIIRRRTTGYLRELGDVDVTGITNGSSLIWNSVENTFKAGASSVTSPLTTKGDLYTYSTADARLGVGANGKVLMADSTTATGLKWGDAGLNYQGTWNASTNTPTLTSGTGTNGYFYIVSVAGTTAIDGISDWGVGDWAVFNGTTWQKIDNSEAKSQILDWATATTYGVGDTVTNEGRIYRANTAHTSGSFNADRANWTVITAIQAGSPFAASTFYYANDTIVNANILYKRTANGISGLTFDTTEQLAWDVVGSSSTLPVWLPTTIYKANQAVSYNGMILQRIANGTSAGAFTLPELNTWNVIANYTNVQPWIGGSVYAAGTLLSQGNRIIKATSNILTGATFDNAEAALYTLVSSSVPLVWTASTYYYAGELISEGIQRVISRTASGISGATFNLTESANYILIKNMALSPWQANFVYYFGEEVMYQNGILRAGNAFTSAATFTFLESSNWISMTPGSTVWLPNTIIYENTIVTGTYSDRVLKRNLTSLTPATFTLSEAGNYSVIKPVRRTVFSANTVYYTSEEMTDVTNGDIVYSRIASGLSGFFLNVGEYTNWTLISGLPVTDVTGNYTVVETDKILSVTGAGPLTITIPANRVNKELHVSRLHPGTVTAITIATSGESIVDPTTGVASISTTLPGIANTNAFVDYYKVGTVWQAA